MQSWKANERERDGLSIGLTLKEKGWYKDDDSYMPIESLNKEKTSNFKYSLWPLGSNFVSYILVWGMGFV